MGAAVYTVGGSEGLRRSVSFNKKMEVLCGKEFVVLKNLDSDTYNAYRIDHNGKKWIVPFDACILVT